MNRKDRDRGAEMRLTERTKRDILRSDPRPILSCEKHSLAAKPLRHSGTFFIKIWPGERVG